MDWGKFFLGIGFLAMAYVWRRISVRAYGKSYVAPTSYKGLKKTKDNFAVGLWIVLGVIAILMSFASKNG